MCGLGHYSKPLVLTLLSRPLERFREALNWDGRDDVLRGGRERKRSLTIFLGPPTRGVLEYTYVSGSRRVAIGDEFTVLVSQRGWWDGVRRRWWGGVG